MLFALRLWPKRQFLRAIQARLVKLPAKGLAKSGHWFIAQHSAKWTQKQALFTAHFTHGRNLSDDSVLVETAGEIGLDRVEGQAVLDDQRFADAVRQEQQFWIQQGINGVPAVVFDRQHLVTGAQGVDNFKSILAQLTN
jgi:predicted DsbA family dithiol-disulfide isomerase